MKTAVVLVLLTVALLFFQWDTETTTSQGLYWGVCTDDKLEYDIAYSLRADSSKETFEDDIFIRVFSLPEISESIGSWDDLKFPLCRTSFANETPLRVSSYPELASVLGTLAVRPAGNWSLMSSLLARRFAAIPGMSSYAIKEDDRLWGYEYGIEREATGYTSSAYYSDSWFRKDGTYCCGCWRWSSNWSTDGVSWHYNAFALVLRRSEVTAASMTPVSVLLAAVIACAGVLVIEKRARAAERAESHRTFTHGCDVS